MANVTPNSLRGILIPKAQITKDNIVEGRIFLSPKPIPGQGYQIPNKWKPV
jgi:hypothetical protein